MDPATDGKQLVKRDEAGKFLPGSVPNPRGRIPGSRNFTTKVREALEKVADGTEETHEQLLVKRVMELALKGDERMIKLVWNYLDGMPPQRVDLGQAEGQEPVTVKIVHGAEGDQGLREELGSEG